MNKIFLSLLAVTAIAATDVQAKTDWWDVANGVLDIAAAAVGTANGKVVNTSGRNYGKRYVTPEQFDRNPENYLDWVKVGRARSVFGPMGEPDGICTYKVRGNLIDLQESRFGECPPYIYVHPDQVY